MNLTRAEVHVEVHVKLSTHVEFLSVCTIPTFFEEFFRFVCWQGGAVLIKVTVAIVTLKRQSCRRSAIISILEYNIISLRKQTFSRVFLVTVAEIAQEKDYANSYN